MNNLKRQFVTYEQAKKLSKLGFYEPCFGYYIQLKNPDEGILKIETVDNIDNNSCVYAPTYSQIFTWFRDNHSIQGFIDYFYYDGFQYGYKWVTSDGDYDEYCSFIDDESLITNSKKYEKVESVLLDKLIELLNETNIKLLGT